MSFLTQHGSLRDLARWLFLATLIAAPWFYGGTTAWGIDLTNGLLGLVLVFWVASLAIDRRWPVVPGSLAIISAMILLLGWWMTANAHSVYDSAFHIFVPVSSLLPKFAGSSDYVLSCAMMVRVTLLVGCILLVTEMTQRPRWLRRLWSALAISGGAIALFGLVQKATGAPMIFWKPAEPWEGKTFFATYYYHANAGAFLNLILPAVVGLTCWIVARQERRLARGLLTGAALIVLIAIVSNTSRMAQMVGGLLLVALLATVVRPLITRVVREDKKTLVIGAIIVAMVMVAVAQATHLDQPLLRWQQVTKQLPVDERWAADRAALTAVRDAGALGFGPGVFRAIFRHYQLMGVPHPGGTWRFLHNDYLQTLLEWGWIGALALGAMFFGGIAFAARNYLRAEAWSNRQRILLLCSLLALIGVAIHAAVDFPLQIFSIQLFAATYLGICWGSGLWKVESRK
ncbi:MAG TPA: O-antigen ligase family protein [Chthoniobacterales bacterium]